MLTHKYFAGKVPTPNEFTAIDNEILRQLKELPTHISAAIEKFKFREALGLWMQLARIGNKYLADTAPWKCFADDPARVATILYLCLQIIANTALLGEPFLPFTTQKLTTLLNLPTYTWQDGGHHTLLPAGHTLQKPLMPFSKIQD